jgi:hypothetical protein
VFARFRGLTINISGTFVEQVRMRSYASISFVNAAAVCSLTCVFDSFAATDIIACSFEIIAGNAYGKRRSGYIGGKQNDQYIRRRIAVFYAESDGFQRQILSMDFKS